MFDSLNRHLLSAYGCDWTVTPNFKRLAERTVRFDASYVCSMPCMPARRDLPLNEYTLMPAHMRNAFSVAELRQNQLAGPRSGRGLALREWLEAVDAPVEQFDRLGL